MENAPLPTPAPIHAEEPEAPSEEILSSVDALEGFATARAIHGIKLAPEMNVYYVLLCDGHLATCRQAGPAMKTSHHFLDVYKYDPKPNAPTRVYEILKGKPFAKLLTPPFLFHAKSQAYEAIKQAIATLAQ